MINKKELEFFADSVAASSKAEIIGFDFENKRYWLKKARAGGANIFHRIAFWITKIAPLAPPSFKAKEEALYYEAQKLERLRSLGVTVPRVELLKKDYFVLEDGGKSVLDTVRHASEDEKNLCLKKSIKLLAILHKKGEFHGGAQVKNFTYKNENVYAIDFEESFEDKIPLKELFFRDLLLFFFSLSKHGIEANYEALLTAYEEEADEKRSMRLGFKDFSSRFKKTRQFLSTPFLQKILDKDTKSVIRMLDEFSNI
ncbi:MAG: hypothetical protein GX780_02120 [Campylobacteraceae bacterium]|nr:hypothetical protein [Campylobacteraceae bacterium]